MQSSVPSAEPEELAPDRDLLRRVAALYELAKPSVTSLVILTTLCGALVAPGFHRFWPLLCALVGTTLVVAAANALNMHYERDSDRLMRRTASRPLPTGRLAPETALIFAAVTGSVGSAILFWLVNPLSAALAGFALASYVLAYTPLKRSSSWALQVGAVPGALPPVIGWASVTGSLDWRALALFSVLFFWQIPHFLAIATFRREEYARAGLVVHPNVYGLARTRRAIFGYTLVLIAATLAPSLLHMASGFYTVIALLSGAVFMGYALRPLNPAEAWARRLFFASMPYLVVIFAALVIFS